MKLNTTGVRAVDEGQPYGCYAFRTPEGEILADMDGNIMLKFGMRDDENVIRQVVEGARHYFGVTEGDVIFWPGKRPVTDEEFEEQVQRAAWGLTPDPYDLAAISEELKAMKRNGD